MADKPAFCLADKLGHPTAYPEVHIATAGTPSYLHRHCHNPLST